MHIDSTIASQFDKDHGARTGGLDVARHCAELSKPWVLPPEGQTPDDKLPQPYTSTLTRGMSNIEGKMVVALFPPGMSFVHYQPAAKWRFNPQIDPKQLSTMQLYLQLREMTLMAKLAGMAREGPGNRRRTGFTTAKRQSISQFLITGDSLERLTDDYQLLVYRRDQYITKRDTGTCVLYHITKEMVDPLTLTPEQLETAGISLKDEIERPAGDRMRPLHTEVAWNPLSKTWVIRQEVEKKIISESQELISPYFSTPFELVAGENYGRGWMEQNLGSARTENELTERILDFAALASKILTVADHGSQVRGADLSKRSGSHITAVVKQGVIQDLAVLQLDKLSDFSVVERVLMSIKQDLSAATLQHSESAPTRDRVTAFEYNEIVKELQGVLGGLYAPIADCQQVPLVDRLDYQMQRDHELRPMPDDAVEIEAVTGIQALSRETEHQALMETLGALAQFPGVLDRVNVEMLLNTTMRNKNIWQPGLIYTDEEMQAQQQAAMQQQQQMMAGQVAGETAGNVITKQLESRMSA